jgi:addiction module HigA family antidote
MPKAKDQTPAAALQSLMDEYQLNPFKLAAAIKLSNSSTRQILLGKTRITTPVATKLAKLFGNTPEYWLTIQMKTDLAEAAKDSKLSEALKTIVIVKKPAPVKTAPKTAAPKAKSGKIPAGKTPKGNAPASPNPAKPQGLKPRPSQK